MSALRRASARLCSALVTALLLGVSTPARPAAAQATVVLPDLAAPPELSVEAAAVSLLLRSYLKPGERQPVPRHELALAIEAFTGRAPRGSLTVSNDLAPRLAEQLGADRILVAQLQSSAKRLVATGLIYGPAGKRVGRISVGAAMGELADMARQIALRLAPAIGATVVDGPAVGLADLRPFVAAQAALLVGDAAAAARAIEVALPNTAAHLPAVLDVLRSLAEEPSLLKQTRVQARLLMGEWAAAVELADEGLAADPKNIALRAAKARAQIALRDFDAAERELDALKGVRNVPAVVVARAALAVERGDSLEKRDEALSSLLGRPASEWRVALPLVAASPPGTFGPQVEAAALAAAQKLAPQEPGLASTVAARALTAGAAVGQAAPLIKVQDLSTEQIKAVGAQLDKVGGADPAAAALSQEIKSRQSESEQVRATAQGPERPVGPPSTLAHNLRTLLQEFDLLYEPTLTAVTIAPLPGSGQPLYWPFLVRSERLSDGLIEALMRPPWELSATRSKIRTEEIAPSRATEDALAVMAHDMGGEAVLMYRIQPAGLAPWANVDLILFDVSKQKVYRASSALIGRSTGLVMFNPLVLGLCLLALAGTVAWLVALSFRGAIVVRVQWDPDSKEEMFSILISQSNKTPVIENPTAYQKKLEWLGQRKRRFEAWQVERSTTFRGIPKGKYFVHLYGIYTRGRQVLVLSEPCEAVEVLPRKTAFVAFNLEASEAEFKLTVVDDNGPVEGARVWVDQDRAKAAATPKQGNVTLKVPKGYHIIHVSAKGIQVERPYHVIKAKIHEMTINLVWERRQEHVSRALEHQVDDALPYLTMSRKASGGAPHAARAAAATDSSGDTIQIPAAGRDSAGPMVGSLQGPLNRPSQMSETPTAPRPSPASPHATAAAGRMTLRPLTPQAAAPDDAREPPLDLNMPVDLEPGAAPSDLDRPVDLVPPDKPRRTR
ncbi:MAG: tetratricopeptide repeat protein [Polyangia bacterium]